MGRLDTEARVRAVLAEVDGTEDAREAYSVVTRAIDEIRADGADVPAELIKAREIMAIDCRAQSQGR
ncbi:MAG: hypothetical protein AAFY53_01250 [Pseudomonadota bacterium]